MAAAKSDFCANKGSINVSDSTRSRLLWKTLTLEMDEDNICEDCKYTFVTEQLE
jgi:hypothetical protein